MAKSIEQSLKEAIGGLVFDLVMCNHNLEVANEKIAQLTKPEPVTPAPASPAS